MYKIVQKRLLIMEFSIHYGFLSNKAQLLLTTGLCFSVIYWIYSAALLLQNSGRKPRSGTYTAGLKLVE
jgi:hypothetical protein